MAKPFISDRRIYLNADKTKVLEHDDPEARWLLAGEGVEVDAETVKQYNLKHLDAPAEDAPTEDAAPEGKAEAAPQANKAVSKAPANKAKE